jgi:hypothetical protein
MIKLKDFYTKKCGYDYNQIENSPLYLSELADMGVIEIDSYLFNNKNNDFSNVQELAGILKKSQLKDTDNDYASSVFPYHPFWKAIKKNSDKDIKHFSELALEMRLLRSELNDIPSNPEKLKELRSALNELSREFRFEEYLKKYPGLKD